MKWSIDDVPIFIAIIDTSGISSAADFLEIPKSSVSRALSRLEDALGVRLVERNSRNLRITSEGGAFYHHCLQIMEQVNETNALMSGLTSTPKGKLVVTLPMAFSREIFARHLARFHRKYPDIELEVMITSHPVDIIRNQIDIAVMIGPLEDSELIGKHLMASPLVWVTSPVYRIENKLGNSPNDLVNHVLVCEKRYSKKKLEVRYNNQKTSINLSKVIQINDPIAVREAVVNGAGVALVPEIYCRDELREGSLIAVYPNIKFESPSPLLAVYPSRHLMSNKVRAFLEFLEEITTPSER